jgi:hypothetical protein
MTYLIILIILFEQIKKNENKIIALMCIIGKIQTFRHLIEINICTCDYRL